MQHRKIDITEDGVRTLFDRGVRDGMTVPHRSLKDALFDSKVGVVGDFTLVREDDSIWAVKGDVAVPILKAE